MAAQQNINIRPATPADCDEIMRLIIELFDYEKLEDQVEMTVEVLRRDCFGEKPLFYCIVAEPAQKDSSKLVGYALYCSIYSTLVGASVYLEDIYVTPAYRTRGIGKQMMKHVTKAALDMGCSRLQLSVLGWNKMAKDFYSRYGYVDVTEKQDWHVMRMQRKAMEEYVKNINIE
ncbi:thialysine N-epsilon-acetyltransferase-like [Physella acuta]|uniref:thialysine N-epsilon-acetyltransferase-like n=1 Tax=Physella acuta TaxID=109671 RepID=UPI0027DD1231|nr:thialysine N-epsilon-acetyltransferase-like [Physella acuta]